MGLEVISLLTAPRLVVPRCVRSPWGWGGEHAYLCGWEQAGVPAGLGGQQSPSGLCQGFHWRSAAKRQLWPLPPPLWGDTWLPPSFQNTSGRTALSLGVALGPLPCMTSAHPALWPDPSSQQSLESVNFLKLVKVGNVCQKKEALEPSSPEGLRFVKVDEAMLPLLPDARFVPWVSETLPAPCPPRN